MIVNGPRCKQLCGCLSWGFAEGVIQVKDCGLPDLSTQILVTRLWETLYDGNIRCTLIVLIQSEKLKKILGRKLKFFRDIIFAMCLGTLFF